METIRQTDLSTYTNDFVYRCYLDEHTKVNELWFKEKQQVPIRYDPYFITICYIIEFVLIF